MSKRKNKGLGKSMLLNSESHLVLALLLKAFCPFGPDTGHLYKGQLACSFKGFSIFLGR